MSVASHLTKLPNLAKAESAVDQDHLAGDVRRAGQAHDHLGHILGGGRTLQRSLGLHELAHHGPVLGPRGVDQPRA